MKEYVHVLAYDDHADGNTYLTEEHHVPLHDSLCTAIEILARHDNACIVDEEAYNDNTHDFYTIAPYAINMSLGIYAKPKGYYK